MAQDKNKSDKITIWNKNFICVMLSNFMLCLAHFSVNPLVATYTKYLQTSVQLMGILTGMFFGVSFLMRPVAGPLTTKFDKRKLLIIVFSTGSVANLGYALFHNVPAFIAFRFLNGVQYSLVGSLIMTLAGDNLPKEKLASGMGVYGLGGAIGIAIAPSIGGALLEFGTRLRGEGFGFTLVFLFGTVILAAAVIPGIIMTPDKKSREETAKTGAWYKNIVTVHALPATIVLFLVMIAYSLYNTYMFEFANERGISGVGTFYTVLALALAVSRPMSGYLSDRLGVERIMFPALVLFALSFVIVGGSTSIGIAIIGGIIAAVGFGSAQPALQAMAIQSETALKRGVASNTIYVGIDLAFFTGPYLGSLVYGKFDYSTMYKSGAIPVCAALVCFALIIPAYRRRRAELG